MGAASDYYMETQFHSKLPGPSFNGSMNKFHEMTTQKMELKYDY